MGSKKGGRGEVFQDKKVGQNHVCRASAGNCSPLALSIGIDVNEGISSGLFALIRTRSPCYQTRLFHSRSSKRKLCNVVLRQGVAG